MIPAIDSEIEYWRRPEHQTDLDDIWKNRVSALIARIEAMQIEINLQKDLIAKLRGVS